MRLIDADELKKKIRHWNYNATTSTPTFDFVTDEDIDDMPTVDVLECIRAEIEQFVAVDKADVLQIIDKYTKGEQE